MSDIWSTVRWLSSIVAGLVLLATMLATTAVAQNATPTPVPVTQPEPPQSGPGSDAILKYSDVDADHYGEEPGGFWIIEPGLDGSNDGPEADEPFPVILYLSGCCGENSDYPTPEEVAPWLNYMAQQGYVVIAPVYNSTRPLDDLALLLPEAIAELESGSHVTSDIDQFTVLAFSFGGGMAVNYAATAAELGLPIPKALFLAAPCGDGAFNFCVANPVDPALPVGLKAVVLEFDVDGVVNQFPQRVYGALTSLPVDDRDFITMQTDAHGMPPLYATHQTPYDSVDMADRWGIWKISSALLACALRGEWCEYALGNTPEQRGMGVWSDGVPVKEMVVVDDPLAA